MKDPLLEVKNLATYYFTRQGTSKAIDEVSFNVNSGEIMGIVGESGCGKTTLASSILRLVPKPGRIVKGEIFLNGINVRSLSQSEFDKKIRWKKLSLIPQAAMSSLDPLMRVGDQIAEVLTTHTGIDDKEALNKVEELLEMTEVGKSKAREYPHELSGGMKQRVLIAMALSCRPDLIIADEPTTALDVIVQAQILKLMENLKKSQTISIMFITHDVPIASTLCDKLAVMYAGEIVEFGETHLILDHPCHPYTLRLIEAVLSITSTKSKLIPIEGQPPDPLNYPVGCRFNPRCSYVQSICYVEKPLYRMIGDNRYVACHFAGKTCSHGGK